MKSCDFLFIYEVKPREIESVILLKKELERRGYSVMIEHMWSQSRRTSQINAKVVITSSCLDDVMFGYVNEIAYKPQKVINLQWEQVVSNDTFDNYRRISENNALARKAVHLSWGPINKERLISLCKIDEKNIFITGHVAMDFLRPEYRAYCKSREEICKEFNLNASKEIVTFISSFPSTEEYQEIDERYKVLGYDKAYLTIIDVTKKSQPKLLEWIGEVLKNDDRHEFVYRPHPREKASKTLLEFEKKHKNFHVISDYSVKQWILNSDKLYTWVSTSIAEAYLSKRYCMIVRPFEYPHEYDIEIYNDATVLTTFEQFKDSFFDDNCRAENFSKKTFPIPEKEFDAHYYSEKDKPTYIRTCDVFEEVFKDDKYIIKEQEKLKKKKITLKRRIVIYGRKYASVSPLLNFLSKRRIFKKSKLASVVNNNRANRAEYLKVKASRKEIRDISNKIDSVFGF